MSRLEKLEAETKDASAKIEQLREGNRLIRRKEDAEVFLAEALNELGGREKNLHEAERALESWEGRDARD